MLTRVQVAVEHELDLNNHHDFVELPVPAAGSFCVQAELLTGGWGNAVLTLMVSVGGSWEAASGVATIVTGARIVRGIAASGERWGVRVSTVAGAAGTARILVAALVED